MSKENFEIIGKPNLPNEDLEAIKEYIKQLEFKRKMGLPEKAKPIRDYDTGYGLGDILNFAPLCPHCKEWSYYTTSEADRNGGYTVCPFCEGPMYDETYLAKED